VIDYRRLSEARPRDMPSPPPILFVRPILQSLLAIFLSGKIRTDAWLGGVRS
jgi:hypothetical protein